MGVDALLFARGVVSDQELAAATAYVRARVQIDPYTDSLGPILVRCEPDIIELHNLDRYYGPEYERGWWPEIYNNILVLRQAFKNCTIHYGSDSLDYEEIPEMDYDLLGRLWAHWLGPDGQNYYERKSSE